jgi:ParB-like chromosome segregation protein Spo0J
MSTAAPTPPPARNDQAGRVHALPVRRLVPCPFSLSLYGPPDPDADGLLSSVRDQGILEPLIVVARALEETGDRPTWEVLSGHRRLAAARALGLKRVPCVIRATPLLDDADRRRIVLDANRQRPKTFSQRMREADALESLVSAASAARRRARLRQWADTPAPTGDAPDRRGSDERPGRTDQTVAKAVGLGGKDLYRQARAVWRAAQAGDPRATAAVSALDAGAKTVHAAYKDLRRRDRFSAGFRPTPYDVWAFRHDRAFGIPHPGDIPPAIIAHAIHYFCPPGGLVVDPTAGGGTTLDVCQSMGRRCLAYDLHPVRPEIQPNDLRQGLPPESAGADLIFCDPPYHTMLSGCYGDGVGTLAEANLDEWVAFLHDLSQIAFLQLAPGGHFALLLACQTEKDLPAGHGYLDHAFLGYQAARAAGFQPVRRISCPMSGGHRPQQVRRARDDGHLLGLVRDLLVMRKPRDIAALVALPQPRPAFDTSRAAPIW